MESEIIDNLKDKFEPELIKKILDENRNITLKNNTDNADNNV
jgi:hypothetical protein